MSSPIVGVSTPISNRARTLLRSARDLFGSKTIDPTTPIPNLEGKERTISSPIAIPKSNVRDYFSILYETSSPRRTISAKYNIDRSKNGSYDGSENSQRKISEPFTSATLSGEGCARNVGMYPRWPSCVTPPPKVEMLMPTKHTRRSPLASVFTTTSFSESLPPKLQESLQYEPVASQPEPQESLHHKPSWSHPFPSITSDIKRRSIMIKKRLFGSTAFNGKLELPLSTPPSTNINIHPELRRRTTVEILRMNKRAIGGDMQSKALIKAERAKRIGDKQRRRGVGVDLEQRLTTTVSESSLALESQENGQRMKGKQTSSTSSCYSRDTNDEEWLSSVRADSLAESDTELASIFDAYAKLTPTGTEQGADELSNSRPLSPACTPNTWISQSEATTVSESTAVLDQDYESDGYFHQQVALLEADLANSGISILRSKYFREALRINDMDPKCDDRNWEEFGSEG
jgi:hypothetical protein